ncbi:hypothetical protein Ancab_035439 [Ancistrocladus abbreviatus]
MLNNANDKFLFKLKESNQSMSNVDGHQTSENEEQLQDPKEMQKREDENLLNFMDSLDSYLTLLDSLSSTLRQGWLELASARHSMGASRLNGGLLDLKFHHAATYLQVNKDKVDSTSGQPNFTLCKWTPLGSGNSGETAENAVLNKFNGLHLRCRSTSSSPELQNESSSEELQGGNLSSDGSPLTPVEQVQKERFKSLAVFGTLVSPKLRAAQLSFETALETLVDIANVRSSMLFAFDRVRKDVDGRKDS